jgi:hypothetical protein
MSPVEEWDVGFNMEEEEVFMTLPEGQYIARCDNIEKRESKKGGFNNLWWKMVVVDGDLANRSITGITHLKPDTPHIGFLRACASLRPDLSMSGRRFKPSDFIGRKCVIDVKANKYKDQKTGEERENTRLDDWAPLPDSKGVEAKGESSSGEEEDQSFPET